MSDKTTPARCEACGCEPGPDGLHLSDEMLVCEYCNPGKDKQKSTKVVCFYTASGKIVGKKAESDPGLKTWLEQMEAVYEGGTHETIYDASFFG